MYALLQAWRAHMRHLCAELGAKHAITAEEVRDVARIYASSHPDHEVLVWRWLHGEDFCSEVGPPPDSLHQACCLALCVKVPVMWQGC